ncbi:secondary thiamine-phosphate synthase enzyme YjbQ [Paenibacillus ihumii]|uniref:secondary thiamine-phosphate synthase enzyme YjbQ n=1 Tax=Paenibacillus ihumii TaxID=687436 RepID=UPI0006D7D490|nr:secondary thiamine-phosphate synthase enzyme YjbQ [Paenibacillus ihumii]
MLYTLEISTTKRDEMKEITEEVRALVRKSGIQHGIAVVYCPHTTAGIAINENADPDVKHDVLLRLDEVYPWNHPKYRHIEGNTASHLKAITTGTSQTIIIHNGSLVLGRWQGIYFCEFDGPRMRQCHVKIIKTES